MTESRTDAAVVETKESSEDKEVKGEDKGEMEKGKEKGKEKEKGKIVDFQNNKKLL